MSVGEHVEVIIEGADTYRALLRIVTRDVNENLTKLQGEGRMVRKKAISQVGPSDLICICKVAGKFQTWWKGKFRQANTNISERNPKTVYP